MHCVQQLRRWNISGKIRLTWTCTKDNCNKCEGDTCSIYTYITSVEIEDAELPSGYLPILDCKYGNTVKLEVEGQDLFVYEIAPIGKQGENTVPIQSRL